MKLKRNEYIATRPLGGRGGDISRYDDISIVSDFHARYRVDRISKKGTPVLLTPASIKGFRKIIYGYYRKFKRDFPWRHTDNPYHILVSEIMLQQTQTSRVEEKYPQFINAFPTIDSLAAASLKDVLTLWQGMGYNRRARYLFELAGCIHKTRGGEIPDTPDELSCLPGIGRATAASICAFAFNSPVVFIETNIRAVYIHFFFHGRNDVHDAEIMPPAEACLDRSNPRLWYSALMDYGAMLKRRHPNPSRRSAHHQKQPRFEGSRRQARGIILKTLLEHRGITAARLAVMLVMPEDAVGRIIDQLVREGLIRKQGTVLRISE